MICFTYLSLGSSAIARVAAANNVGFLSLFFGRAMTDVWLFSTTVAGHRADIETPAMYKYCNKIWLASWSLCLVLERYSKYD